MVGVTKPVILEKWTTAKKPTGSLGDTLVTRVTIYAEIERAGGNRSYENAQTKFSDVYRVKIRHSGLDLDSHYKLVYRGERHTIQSIERIDEKRFNYLLIVQVK